MYVYVFLSPVVFILCRVVCMPGLFSFLFLPVGTPAWVVWVVEMPRRGCLHLHSRAFSTVDSVNFLDYFDTVSHETSYSYQHTYSQRDTLACLETFVNAVLFS